MLRRLVHTRLLAASAALQFFLLAAGVGCAAHDEPNALRQEIGDLKGTIEHLNARIEHLERQGSAPPAASSQAAAAPPLPAASAPGASAPGATEQPATLRQRWRSITYGMTFEQVDALLGPPRGRIDESQKMIWFYSYPDLGSGSIVFIDSAVSDWQAPPFGYFAYWP